MNWTQSRDVSVTQRDAAWCRLQIKVSLTSGSVLSCPSGQLLPHITATHEIKYNDSWQGNISNIKWRLPEWKTFPSPGFEPTIFRLGTVLPWAADIVWPPSPCLAQTSSRYPGNPSGHYSHLHCSHQTFPEPIHPEAPEAWAWPTDCVNLPALPGPLILKAWHTLIVIGHLFFQLRKAKKKRKRLVIKNELQTELITDLDREEVSGIYV